MDIIKKFSLPKFVLLLILGIFFTYPSQARAADISLGTSPQAEYLQLNPGEIYDGFFAAWNKSEETTMYFLYVSGFKQLENFPGTSIPLTPTEDADSPYSASEWFHLPQQQIQIEPNVTDDIYYTITVPTDISNGTYNAKIFLSTKNTPEGATEAQTVTDLATGPSFLITVGEDLIEEMKLYAPSATETAFRTDKKLYEKIETTFLTTVQNTGNTYLTPEGEIIITNFLDKEIARIPFNSTNRSILRENIAEYTELWKEEKQVFDFEEGRLLIGPMEAKLVATYKTENPGYNPIIAYTTFLILPWKLLLIALLIIILLVFIRKYLKENVTVSFNKKDSSQQ